MIEGKHWRMALGAALMSVSVVFATKSLSAPRDTTATWAEVVYHFGFPALLFVGGYNLFSRQAFRDAFNAGRRLIRRRTEDK